MLNIDGKFKAVAVPVTTEDGRSVYAQIGSSKEKQTPQVVVNFSILEGDYAGVTVSWTGFFTDKTAQRTIEALRFIGFKGDDLDAIETQTLDQEVQIVVAMEPSQKDPTKSYPRVLWVNRIGGGGLVVPAMESAARRQLNAQMKGLLKSTPAVDGPKAGPGGPPPLANGRGAPPPSESSDAGDDVPFR